VSFNSSWAIFPLKPFSTADEFIPRKFYGKTFQLDRSQHKAIAQLRQWASDSFENQSVLSTKYLWNLSDIPSSVKQSEKDKKMFYKDFDLQCKVL
jgi:hypothetical protein